MSLALVDCNNFFASCERVCNPKLENKPIVVLSANDGCVIARSNEAKALGVPMGAPAFMCQELFKKYDIHVFSSNFALYLDMSTRVMQILKTHTSALQIYSIDEAFLSFDHLAVEEYEPVAKRIREQILSWTGLPVSIGIAPTKTLAKVANHFAKKANRVCVLNIEKRKAFLERLNVEDIWGIGKKLAERLRKKEVYTAWQLCEKDDSWLRRELSVVGLRLAWELRGQKCLDLEEVQAEKKSLSSAKSFTTRLSEYNAIGSILAGYTARLAEKLREQKKKASYLKVFLPDTDKEVTLVFPVPTSYTPTLISFAKKGLANIYERDVAYKKVGILLGGFVPETHSGDTLFFRHSDKKEKQVMKVCDEINDRYGKNSLFFAAAKENNTRSLLRSPRYTTSWDELITVSLSN